MNRERGLLERAMNRIDFRYAQDEAIALHKEIREYLDKPEQAELLEILEEIIADLKLRASLTEHPLVINISNGVYVKAITAIEKHRS